MGNQSALIVPIPEVEPLVGPLRLRYDASARLGVPAHVTVLYPFRPAQLVLEESPALRDICASIGAFEFSFTEVRRFPEIAYLHPDRAEPFAQITRTLTARWPDCQPYNGAFSDVIPHMTVAQGVDSETLGTVEDFLRLHLPVRCVARQVWLMTSNDEGLWSKSECFPLAFGRED